MIKHTDVLKPCPFCGSVNIDVRQEYSHSPYEAVCEDCGVIIYRPSMQEARDA